MHFATQAPYLGDQDGRPVRGPGPVDEPAHLGAHLAGRALGEPFGLGQLASRAMFAAFARSPCSRSTTACRATFLCGSA
ncbi:hypothetical protein [Streptomyces sp. NPDC002491]